MAPCGNFSKLYLEYGCKLVFIQMRDIESIRHWENYFRTACSGVFKLSPHTHDMYIAQIGLLRCRQRDGVQGIKVPYQCEKFYSGTDWRPTRARHVQYFMSSNLIPNTQENNLKKNMCTLWFYSCEFSGLINILTQSMFLRICLGYHKLTMIWLLHIAKTILS